MERWQRRDLTAKQHLQDIWMAETRKEAENAFGFFLEAYGAKHDKAAACLAKGLSVTQDGDGSTYTLTVFKPCPCAQRKWRKLDGSNQPAEIIRGVKFVNGECQDRAAA